MARSRTEIDDAGELILGADGQLDGHRAAPRRSRISSTTAWKSAPARSILLTKARRGTWNLSAWCHTVSDCGSTPETPQNTTTAPSSTRSERSTSMVKSTWPGVSMRWMSWLRQVKRGGRGGDGDAALALLRHPVHLRLAVVDLADLVDAPGVEEEALADRRLAGVDVRDDADVAHAGQLARASSALASGLGPGSDMEGGIIGSGEDAASAGCGAADRSCVLAASSLYSPGHESLRIRRRAGPSAARARRGRAEPGQLSQRALHRFGALHVLQGLPQLLPLHALRGLRGHHRQRALPALRGLPRLLALRGRHRLHAIRPTFCAVPSAPTATTASAAWVWPRRSFTSSTGPTRAATTSPCVKSLRGALGKIHESRAHPSAL